MRITVIIYIRMSGIDNPSQNHHPYERLITDVKTYRALGATADRTIQFGNATLEVRDYQIEAGDSIKRRRETGGDSALLPLATGLGKTTIAVIDMLDFMVDTYERQGEMPDVLWTAHQNELLDQVAQRFRLLAPSLSVARLSDKGDLTASPVRLETMQWLTRNLGVIDPNEHAYVTYDESHHHHARTYRKVVDHLNPSFQLALTATPDRMDKEDIRELFGQEVYSKSLAEAMEEGLLVNVDYQIVFDDAVKRALEEGFTSETLGDIRELLKNESRNEAIARQIQERKEQLGLQDAKMIVFCNSVEEADSMAELLGGAAYHSGIKDPVKRKAALDGFRNGTYRTITSRDMINEGVDIPDTDIIAFVRGTASRGLFLQQLGRGMRKHKGKDKLTVFDFAGNIERLEHIKELSDEIAKAYRNRDGRDTDSETESGSLRVQTDHAEFDFDSISIILLNKIRELRERQSRYIPRTIEEAATLWRENFGDEEPTQKSIAKASKEGLFVSHATIYELGGINLLKEALGFETRIVAETLEEAAALWQENFGDEEPTTARINEASRKNLFVSMPVIVKFGGVNALRQALGFEVRTMVETLEEAASLWTSLYGDDEPTHALIASASKEGVFVSPSTITKMGGVNALKVLLGFEVKTKEISTPTSMEEAAELWRSQFDDEATTARIHQRSKEGLFISASTLRKLGGVAALNTALGFEKETITIEEAARRWRQASFGDQIPTVEKINEASKRREFLAYTALNAIGGINALKEALGYEVRNKVAMPQSIEEAAALWRANMEDQVPTHANIIAASKSGLFVSITAIESLGTVDELKQALGLEVRAKVENLNDAVALWQTNLGDQEPTASTIKEASKKGLFVSVETIKKLGGINSLRESLGFKAKKARRSAPKSIEDAATFWREQFGDKVPTYDRIAELSKDGEFVSTYSIDKLGGVSALRETLNVLRQVEAKEN